MGNQELKKSIESMENLRVKLSGSPQETLAFLIRAGIVTPEGHLIEPEETPTA